MSVEWVESAAALEQVAQEASQAHVVAVDAEGDGYFRYRGKLCTLQLAWGPRIALLDTLALSDLSPLQPLLSSEGPLKVLHDAAFDARMLAARGLALDRVFDTAVAARFLGEQATGLASLLQKHFDVRLDKEQQQRDWAERPLDDRALEYLAADVRHLVPLGELMRERLRRAGIEAEAAEECSYVLWKASQAEPPTAPPWMRVKGARELSPRDLAVLRELADVREQAAREADVPPHRVLHDKALLVLARRAPRSMSELQSVRALRNARARRLARAWLAAVQRGRDAGDVPADERLRWQPPAPPAEERAVRRARQQTLTAWRKKEAARREVDPQVVLPGHCLQDLASRGAENEAALQAVPGLGAARLERYAVELLTALRRAEDAVVGVDRGRGLTPAR